MLRFGSKVSRHPGMNAIAFTLRWPRAARPSKGDGHSSGRSSFEARFARTSSDNGEAVARG
jgi:hypothetical protein